MGPFPRPTAARWGFLKHLNRRFDFSPQDWYCFATSLTTFKIGKKEFVILPRRRYNQLTRAEQEQRDAEIARKGREAYLAGKMKTITLEGGSKEMGRLRSALSSNADDRRRKAVGKLPRALRLRIVLRLKPLEENPRPPGSIKLTGQDARRVRVGDYRIIYTIQDDRLIVLVIDIGHRGDVYRR